MTISDVTVMAVISFVLIRKEKVGLEYFYAL